MEINIEDPLSDKLKTILQQNGDSEFDYTPIVNDILNYTMEECTFAISTLLIESKRRQWSTIDLKEYLEKFLSNPHQIKILAKKYEDEMQTLEETLDEIRIPKTRLVEFQWRLQHEVYNSFQGRVSKPKCLIQLQFLKPDTSALKSAKKCKKFVKSLFTKKICKTVQFDETMHCLPQRLKSTFFENF